MKDLAMLYGWVMFTLLGGIVGFVIGYTFCNWRHTHGVIKEDDYE